jgi:hypothetical protein
MVTESCLPNRLALDLKMEIANRNTFVRGTESFDRSVLQRGRSSELMPEISISTTMPTTGWSRSAPQLKTIVRVTSMKFLGFLIAICAAHIFFAAATAQTKTTTNERGYWGPVARVKTETVDYWFEGGKLRHGPRELDSIEIFDSAGRLIQEQSFTDDRAILYEYKYRYDSRGRIEASGTHSKFTYLADRIVYIYDSMGNLVTENGFDSQGKLVNKNEYAYDERRRKIRWTSKSYHPEEHSRPHQWTYDYYDNGLVKQERAFVDEGGSFRPTDTLGTPQRKFFMYSGPDKPAIVLLYSASGAFAGLESTSYDSHGNELEEIRYDFTGALKDKTKYSYQFDKFGNYVTQKTYEWDAEAAAYLLSEISYQTIEYRK